MTLKRLAAKMAPKHAHLISLSEQSGLKNEFCRSDNQVLWQLSVKFQDICQVSVKILAVRNLSVKPIQSLCYEQKSKHKKITERSFSFFFNIYLKTPIFLYSKEIRVTIPTSSILPLNYCGRSYQSSLDCESVP